MTIDEEREVYGTCKNNHPWTPANVRWESSGRGKARRRRCRQCLRDKAAVKAGTYDHTQGAIPAEIKAARPIKTQRALQNFEDAQTADVRGLCYGTAKGNPWTDWDDESDDTIPSPETAEAMCEGCPLLIACRRAGAEHGVWGGLVFVQGSIYKRGNA